MQLHKKVFICCDSDEPGKKGVLVVQMDWDGDVERDDDELKKIGNDAKCEETRVGVKEALAKAREMARCLRLLT